MWRTRRARWRKTTETERRKDRLDRPFRKKWMGLLLLFPRHLLLLLWPPPCFSHIGHSLASWMFLRTRPLFLQIIMAHRLRSFKSLLDYPRLNEPCPDQLLKNPYPHQKTCIRMFTVAIFTVANNYNNYKISTCPSTIDGIKRGI